MSRLKMRTKMLDVFDDVLHLVDSLHKLAMENLDAVMVGYTHMNHGQPITFAHYLLAIVDGLFRGLEVFDLAYRHVNRNSGGCGSCSGTSWPVDRRLICELLGLDDIVEPTYDLRSGARSFVDSDERNSQMKLHIVGSGCPDARQERYGSACLLEVAMISTAALRRPTKWLA